ncbi:MAG: hypothetical protein IPJ88_04515 [Myxococcales bacterium]|nr:MAG: hypothetical protein IPJ88_04515 [Myxococcales bacterium]
MSQIASDARSLLKGFDLAKLNEQQNIVCAIRSDFTIAYTNEHWRKFAEENGGQPTIKDHWGVGTTITDAYSEAVRDYYVARYLSCLESGEPWSHTYQCSSASTYREFHKLVYPLTGRAGLLIVHSLNCEASIEERVFEHDLASLADEQGVVMQCSHCRRIRVPGENDLWVWVPRWVTQSPVNASHGLCQLCLDFYYPDS